MSAMAPDYCSAGQATIDVLPDDVLLEIVDSYLDENSKTICTWHKLVHVRRRKVAKRRACLAAAPGSTTFCKGFPLKAGASTWKTSPFVDTPVLSQLYTVLLGDFRVVLDMLDMLDMPHLRQFIGRARRPKPAKAARVSFDPRYILLEFPPGVSTLRILSPFFSLVERLDLVTCSPFKLRGIYRPEPALFLELFQPFTAVRSLDISKGLPFIAPALQGPHRGKGHRKPFADARQISGRPIAIPCWNDSEEGAGQ
ncbi:hypothetical protein BC826DRAFT_969809 [Russula brevipes]|nr:hypothetical protein BC826DRAFT_969809 [Russula brevipes]